MGYFYYLPDNHQDEGQKEVIAAVVQLLSCQIFLYSVIVQCRVNYCAN